jgi:hypothetical protein
VARVDLEHAAKLRERFGGPLQRAFEEAGELEAQRQLGAARDSGELGFEEPGERVPLAELPRAEASSGRSPRTRRYPSAASASWPSTRSASARRSAHCARSSGAVEASAAFWQRRISLPASPARW